LKEKEKRREQREGKPATGGAYAPKSSKQQPVIKAQSHNGKSGTVCRGAFGARFSPSIKKKVGGVK